MRRRCPGRRPPPRPGALRLMSEPARPHQEVILDHNRVPRNFGTLENANREAEGTTLSAATASVSPCMARVIGSRASPSRLGLRDLHGSASLMTEAPRADGRGGPTPLHGFHDLFARRRRRGRPGQLAVFAGVREYPSGLSARRSPGTRSRPRSTKKTIPSRTSSQEGNRLHMETITTPPTQDLEARSSTRSRASSTRDPRQTTSWS